MREIRFTLIFVMFLGGGPSSSRWFWFQQEGTGRNYKKIISGKLPHKHKIVVAGNHELGFEDGEEMTDRQQVRIRPHPIKIYSENSIPTPNRFDLYRRTSVFGAIFLAKFLEHLQSNGKKWMNERKIEDLWKLFSIVYWRSTDVMHSLNKSIVRTSYSIPLSGCPEHARLGQGLPVVVELHLPVRQADRGKVVFWINLLWKTFPSIMRF